MWLHGASNKAAFETLPPLQASAREKERNNIKLVCTNSKYDLVKHLDMLKFKALSSNYKLKRCGFLIALVRERATSGPFETTRPILSSETPEFAALD
jgi:hypothetical protein